MTNRFTFQFEALLQKLHSQNHDIEKNLYTLHFDQARLAIKIPFLTHEEYSKAINRLEVIKKDIHNQKHELAKVNTKIKETENTLHDLRKKDEKPLQDS